MLSGLLTKEVQRFLVFGIIGLFNSVLDTTIWHFLSKRFLKMESLKISLAKIKLNPYSFAHSISFVITATVSYFMNKTWTWSDSIINDPFQIWRFYSVAAFSWLLSTMFINILTGFEPILKLTKIHPLLEKYWPLLAKLMTIGVTMFTNFAGYSLFVF